MYFLYPLLYYMIGRILQILAFKLLYIHTVVIQINNFTVVSKK